MVPQATTSHGGVADPTALTPAERGALLDGDDGGAGGVRGANPGLAPARSAPERLLATPVPFILLLVLLTAGRVLWLRYVCPYELVEDEAHYWDWSRHLGLSYYSKGPGIAWAIRASTELLGVSAWAVRMPAVVAAALTLLGIGALVADMARTRTVSRAGAGVQKWGWRAALYAVACFALAPITQVPAMLSTIDGPLMACWALACFFAWRALERRSRFAWFAAALAVGAGFLFKYTMLLLLPGFLIYALLRRSRLRAARGWPDLLFAGLVIIVVAAAPVIIWNTRHGWPTFKHLLGHLGVAGGDVPVVADPQPFDAAQHTIWLFEFIGAQIIMVGPALILLLPALIWTLRARGDDPDHDAGRLFLICCGMPVLLFYLVVAFFAEAEGNWAMGAYVTLLPLAGWYAAAEIARYRALIREWRAGDRTERRGIFRKQPETIGQVLWHITIGWGLVAAALLLFLEPISRLPGAERVVPIGRLTRIQMRADDAARHAEALRDETGAEPFFITKHYGVTSQLAFYLPGRPHVLCASALLGGRKTQYDFWAHTDTGREDLIGRPAVMVGGSAEDWLALFGRVEGVGLLEGEHKDRQAFIGFNYHGPARPALPPASARSNP